MAEKNDLKSFKCQFESDLGHMNADELLNQLETLNSFYVWSIKELNKVADSYKKIEESAEFDLYKEEKLDALVRQYKELEKRHEANERIFKKIITESRQYFLDKYNLDILKITKRYLQ